MRTFISHSYSSNEDSDNLYFVFQVDNDVLAEFMARKCLFDLMPLENRPNYLTWFCESWGQWINTIQLSRFLQDMDLDSWEWTEKIDVDSMPVLLPGLQRKMLASTYTSEDDKETPRTDCEQTSVWDDDDIVFKCQERHGSTVFESRLLSLDRIVEALFS